MVNTWSSHQTTLTTKLSFVSLGSCSLGQGMERDKRTLRREVQDQVGLTRYFFLDDKFRGTNDL